MFTRAPSGSSFNVEIRVGALEETFSLTGEALVIDVQRPSHDEIAASVIDAGRQQRVVPSP